jgi:aspartate aminotransferase-like enzyme
LETYRIPLVPGPTRVPAEYAAAYLKNFGSTDIEADFFDLLSQNQQRLGRILKTDGDVVIQSGEGMLVLWGAIKSALAAGDKVLVLSNGLFGRGFADMARAVGAEPMVLEASAGEFVEPRAIEDAIKSFKPRMITAVHCETPSGLLNPIGEIAPIVKESGALFLVDFVASAVGTDVRVDEWGIDLGLLGSQKCLSLLPDLSFTTVSERAWAAAERVGYDGYDALLPWRNAIENRAAPYTHNWHANAALSVALGTIATEGLEKSFERHESVARYCRERVKGMGLELYAKSERMASPTVTAICVPHGWTWKELDGELRGRGMAAGGSYGDLAGKVFRIGHMGSQADMELVREGMDILEEILRGRGQTGPHTG